MNQKYIRIPIKICLTVFLAFLLGGWTKLLFTNSYSPMSGWPLSSLLAIVVPLLIAYGFIFLCRKMYDYSVALFVVLVLSLGGLMWVLFPVACDTHESFREIDDKECECRKGVEVQYYPRGVMDGESTDYCIGFESKTN